MSAVALLARTREAGVEVHVVGGDLRLRGRPAPDLVQAIRAAKPALVEILHGDACRLCGERLRWPGPAGVPSRTGPRSAMAAPIARLGGSGVVPSGPPSRPMRSPMRAS